MCTSPPAVSISGLPTPYRAFLFLLRSHLTAHLSRLSALSEKSRSLSHCHTNCGKKLVRHHVGGRGRWLNSCLNYLEGLREPPGERQPLLRNGGRVRRMRGSGKEGELLVSYLFSRFLFWNVSQETNWDKNLGKSLIYSLKTKAAGIALVQHKVQYSHSFLSLQNLNLIKITLFVVCDSTRNAMIDDLQ